MTIALAVVCVASAIAGLVIGHTLAAVVPVIALGVFYAGLRFGLWGSGVGDGWYYAMAILMVVGIAAAVAGAAIRSTLAGPSARRVA